MRIIISAVLQEHDTHRDRGRFSPFFDLHGAWRGHRVIVGAPADEAFDRCKDFAFFGS
jgi:hypothetical protein